MNILEALSYDKTHQCKIKIILRGEEIELTPDEVALVLTTCYRGYSMPYKRKNENDHTYEQSEKEKDFLRDLCNYGCGYKLEPIFEDTEKGRTFIGERPFMFKRLNEESKPK